MINLFIDTNIFLNFFSFSDDHLSKLEELIKLIKKADVRLFLPEQLVDEFYRNREVRLKLVIDHLDRFIPRLQVPVICHNLAQMKEIQKRIEEITKFTNELRKVLDTQIEQHSLHADKLISDIFALGVLCPSSAELVQTAKLRYDRGNPPGKDRSYGDAINWETLLAVCPDKEDLYFVGGDRDYTSPIKPSAFSSFLRREWEKRKHSSVHYYELISEFIKQKFAQIQITDDQIQEEKRVATEFPPLSGTYGTASVPSISGGLGYLGAFLTKEKLARCPYCGFEFNARKSSSFLDIAAGLKSETWSQQCPNCQRSFFV